MLTKLLKYECKTTWGTLYPVALGVIGLSALFAVLNAIANSLPALADTPFFFAVRVLVGFLFGLGLFAAMLACVFVVINRFYRLLGEEGYLLLSLPATAFEQIAAKLICAILTTLLALAVGALCTYLGTANDRSFAFQLPTFDGGFFNGLLAALYGNLLVILLLAGAYLFLYLCIAIAGHWPQQRLLASIISYFVLSFLGQIAFFAVMAVGVMTVFKTGIHWDFAFNISQTTASVSLALIFALLIAGVDAILWAVTQNQMTKHLNLP